jgi:hypothetical protein
MVVETNFKRNTNNDLQITFNPPLVGMVVETNFKRNTNNNLQITFNPPLVGMVVETALAGISAGAGF